MTGWLLDTVPPTLVLEEPARGLRLVDDRGARLGSFEGAAAEALRARLDGRPDAGHPALAAALRHAPALERALLRRALPLAPADLLRRGRWQQLFVELTAACNERCGHCYAAAGPERREALDRPTVEAVLRDAAALAFECVQLTGGEALLCAFLADACRLARDLGVPVVEVYTNGVLLTAERYAPLRAAGVAFALSLYARDPAAHDAVTRLPGSHARTVAAIRRALEGGSEVRVGVIATRPEDEAQAVEGAALARELGVPAERVGLDVSRAVGRGAFAGRDVPAGGPADPTHGHLPRDPERAPGGKAAVLPDGRVVPCIFSRRLTLGRVDARGGLRAALERPALALAPDLLARACGDGGPAGSSGGLGALVAEMTCGECRVVGALLEPAP